MVQRRAKLEHNSHIVKVHVKATCLHFNPWRTLNETTEPAGLFGTMSQEPCHFGKGAKQDHVTQLNCRETCTHESYRTSRI